MSIDLTTVLPLRRIVCVRHPGGPFVLYEGVEPEVKTECGFCRAVRLKGVRREEMRALRRHLRRRPQTAEELALAGDPFVGFRGEDS